MNATEARNESIKSQPILKDADFDSVMEDIVIATKEGEFNVIIHTKLHPVTVDRIRGLGYNINYSFKTWFRNHYHTVTW